MLENKHQLFIFWNMKIVQFSQNRDNLQEFANKIPCSS